MNLEDYEDETQPYVLVEGPRWADAEFYGKWLLAAAKAKALWEGAMKDPGFMKKVDRLKITSVPDFSITATVLLSWLEKNLASLAVGLYEAEGGTL